MQRGEAGEMTEDRRHKVLVWIWRSTDAGPRVLLLKRAPPRRPEWHPVTGHVEPRETLEQAAVREAHEETGCDPVEVRDLEYDFGFTDDGNGKTRPFVEHAFAMRVDADSCELSDEHDDYEWAAIPEAGETLRFPEQREALRHLAERLGVETPWVKGGGGNE